METWWEHHIWAVLKKYRRLFRRRIFHGFKAKKKQQHGLAGAKAAKESQVCDLFVGRFAFQSGGYLPSRCWFQIFFIFTPKIGEMIQF